MLWALLAVYLFASMGASGLFASFEHAKEYIKSDIGDEARRKELLAIVEDARDLTKEELKTRAKIVKELSDVLERHDSTAGDIQPVLERYRARVEAYQARMIKYRFDLKGKMTREEWAKVIPAEKAPPTVN